MKNFAEVSKSLSDSELYNTISKLDSTLASTQEIMAKINNSEGSAGLFINDSTLYMNLEATTESLNKLLVDLKENPNRYVQFSMFGKKDKK